MPGTTFVKANLPSLMVYTPSSVSGRPVEGALPFLSTSRTMSAWIGIVVAPSRRPVTMSAVTEKPGRIVSGGFSILILTLKLIASELAVSASRSGSFLGIGEEPTSVTVPMNLVFG